MMENQENILRYTLAVTMAESMLEKGIISKDDYNKIEQKFCEKYCINLSSIFRKIAGYIFVLEVIYTYQKRRVLWQELFK